MSPSILDQCGDPRETRRKARHNVPTPCHRCLAFRPDTPSGCLLIETGAVDHPAPKPPKAGDQRTIW